MVREIVRNECHLDEFTPIWNSTVGDINFCFRQICLTIPIYALFAIFSVYYVGKMRFVNYHIQWNLYQSFIIYSRAFICAILAFLPIFNLLIQFGVYNQRVDGFVEDSVKFIKTLSWILHLTSVLRLKRDCRYNTRSSYTLIVIWIFTAIISICEFRSRYFNHFQNAYVENDEAINYLNFTISAIEVTFQGFYLLSILPGRGCLLEEEQFRSLYQLINDNAEESRESHSDEDSIYLNQFNDEDEVDPLDLGVAKENSSYLSILFFNWVNVLLKRGACGGLKSPDDLFELPNYICTSHISTLFQSKSDLSRGFPRSTLSKLHSAFGIQFYSIGILKFLSDSLSFSGPILLNLLVSFIEEDVGSAHPNEDWFYGYKIVIGLFTTAFFGALLNIHFNMSMAEVNMKLRASLITSIFRKTLRLKKTMQENFNSSQDSGDILNLMSVDTDRFVNICPSFHALWSLPLQIIVTLYLLYLQIGVSFLAGLTFSIILIPINKLIANKIGHLSTKMMKFKDARIKLMSEILYGMKIVKFHNWESLFIQKVQKIRDKELKSLRGRKYLDALCVYLWACTPVLVSLLSFGTFILLGNNLTATKVFTSLALFNMLISPLNAIPWVINGFVEALVSYRRIAVLLDIEDDEPGNEHSFSYDEIKNDIEISLKKASFDWDKTTGFELVNLSLTAKKGEMIGIYGDVGSGKSSLFLALLGELNKNNGSMSICDRDGIGLVLHEPWIQRGSIRMNILFGKPYNSKLYNDVITASCLDDDLKEMAKGDKTQIGEGTLSGGQKARLSLARALYQDKKIYIIDDIYSAVDLQVAKNIHKRCIMGLLKNKTRLISTHHLSFFQSADKILVMGNGHIVGSFGPKDILPILANGDESRLIKLSDAEDSDEEILENNILTLRRKRTRSGASETFDKSDRVGTTSTTNSTREREVNDEILEKGSISFQIYKEYFIAVGLVLSPIILLTFILMQLSRNLSDVWLAHWITSMNSNITNQSTPTVETSEFHETTFVEYFGDKIPYISALDPETKYYMTIFILIGVSNTFFTLFRAFLFAYGGVKAAYKLHSQLISSVLKAKMQFFESTPIGRIFNRFSSDISTSDDSLPFIMNILLAQTFGLLGTLILTCYSMPWILVLLIPLLLICNNIQIYYRKTARQLRRISNISLSPIYAHFSEVLKGLVTIRSFRALKRFELENEMHLEANQKGQYSTQALSNWLSFRLQLVGVFIITGVGLIGVIQHQLGIALPGIVGLAISYALTVTSSLNGFITFLTETEKEIISVERISEYINTIEEESQTESLIPIPFGWPNFGVLAFQNVSFRYRSDAPLALKNITFETRNCEKIGVVGRTGAGKSSLFQIIFRMVDSYEGNIIIDSLNTRHLSLNDLRSRLCIIPQDPTIFSGSLRLNLDPKGIHTDDDIYRAMNKCLITDIARRIGGLDCDVGDLSNSLSAGQKQLVCLARALLSNAKIICIDEATSNVDVETDKLIQKTIRSCFRQNTVITIAHRINTVLQYDRIIVIENGEIKEFDTPENLMSDKSSLFYSLAQ